MSHLYSVQEFNYHPRSSETRRASIAAPNNDFAFVRSLVSCRSRLERLRAARAP